MSMISDAFLTARKAASDTDSGLPTNVTTVRLVSFPGSTSSSFTPSTDSIASVICLITDISLPSLKFGTHSIILFLSINNVFLHIIAPCPPKGGVIQWSNLAPLQGGWGVFYKFPSKDYCLNKVAAKSIRQE